MKRVLQTFVVFLSILASIVGEHGTHNAVRTPCDHNNGGCSSTCFLSTNEQDYSCACPPGISLLSDKKTCAHEGHSFLLLANGKNILKISPDDTNYTVDELQLGGILGIADVDFDPLEGKIYWTELYSKVIRRAYLNGSGQQDIVSSDLSFPSGIAIDYTARKLYWTDSYQYRIEMSDLSGTNRKIIMRDETAVPGAIVVDTRSKRIYWTDFMKKRIESSSLDGTNRSVFIELNEGRPTSLALDDEQRIIYWGYYNIEKIEMADVDLSDRRVLISNSISQVFGLTVLGDYIYWTDREKKVIERADKKTGDNRQVIVDNLHNPRTLKLITLRNVKGEKCKGLSFDFLIITYDPEREKDFLTEMEHPHGTRATVTCEYGFEIFPFRPIVTNAATTVCVNGQWKPDIANCTAARCSCAKLPQEMMERKRKLKYCETFVSSGTNDQMTECEEGYQAKGNYGANCAWGVWYINTPVTQVNRCVRIKDCRLDLKGNDDLTALHRNHTFEGQEAKFVHHSLVKFTCKSFYSTLEGTKTATCMDGQWSEEIPKCKRTSAFDVLHPPFLWVYFANFNRINTDDGRVMIPKETLFKIGCWSPEERQLKLIERNTAGKQFLNVNFSSEDMFSSVKVIDSVREKTEATVECINSKGISTKFDVVIADTCEVDENELNRRGLQVVPDSRQRIYVEGDRIQVECSSNENRTDQFIIICKSGREWEYASNMDC